ncbi:MAG TPA: PilZ domain-containing protein [Caulobacteraceae bacterium]
MLAQSSTQERRVSVRVPVRLDARVFPGTRSCLVRDLSAHGARIQFDEPGGGPDEVVLVLWDSGQAFEAQAVWWLNDEIGVRFIRACELTNPVPVPFQDAKQVWQGSRPPHAVGG